MAALGEPRNLLFLRLILLMPSYYWSVLVGEQIFCATLGTDFLGMTLSVFFMVTDPVLF